MYIYIYIERERERNLIASLDYPTTVFPKRAPQGI